MLNEIGKRVALSAGIAVGDDVWPQNADLRLPLQTHLRAPGGSRRFPVMLPSGDCIDATDAWSALDSLKIHFQPNSPESITAALNALPALPELAKQAPPRHRSDVNGQNNATVIGWYNSNYSLQSVLESVGAEIPHSNKGLICCPFHDDKAPSLAIWRDDKTDKFVCHCHSRNSSCQAAQGAYLDAFDAYKLVNNLSASEAVKQLVDQYGLGQKSEILIDVAPAPLIVRNPVDHDRVVADARLRLQIELSVAAQRKGEVTVINATPGLGKTKMGADLANQSQAQYKHTAIFAPNKEIAAEWAKRLDKPFVWESKLDCCICCDQALIKLAIAMGYALPKCVDPDCPYALQPMQAHGKTVVFQYQHLYIKDGAKVAQAELIIVDESPLSALLPERYVYARTLKSFVNRHPDDPATPLLMAIHAAISGLPQTINDVRGDQLVSAIQSGLHGVTLAKAIRQARRSTFNVAMPAAPATIDLMAPQFLHSLLTVLGNEPSKISFGRCASGEWGLVWHEIKTLALSAYNSLYKPAVIILDGSADETIYNQLCKPWPLQVVTVDCPLSPNVEIVQVNCTPSTRRVISSPKRIEWLARQVAQVANKLNVTIDGGVTFLGAVAPMEKLIGGTWLHYGGQRGHNELSDARTVAVVCSPTTPPWAIERKALALWPDLVVGWNKTGVVGAYQATDARLDAMNKLHTVEELRQAVYRARPITSSAPTKLLVFSPWNLSAIGLQPHQTFTSLFHGNATHARAALSDYTQRSAQKSAFPIGKDIKKPTPIIGNGVFCAENNSYSNQESPPYRQQSITAKFRCVEGGVLSAMWLVSVRI